MVEHHGKCAKSQAWDIPDVPCSCPPGWPRKAVKAAQRPDWVPTCPCGTTVLNQGDLCARCERASTTEGRPRFTENEIKDVLTALYQDGHVDLVLADRVAALMKDEDR